MANTPQERIAPRERLIRQRKQREVGSGASAAADGVVESGVDEDFMQSADATKWAAAFVQRARANPEFATDEGNMIGWFANAIMRGYDEHANQTTVAASVEGVVNESDEQYSIGGSASALTSMVVPVPADWIPGQRVLVTLLPDEATP